jgi:hypothetical protein
MQQEQGGRTLRQRTRVDRGDYEALFATAGNAQAVGEACVSYMYFHRTTIPKIKGSLSDPKIIVILRDPVERTFSNYLHHRRDGFESLPFLEAVRQAPGRQKDNWWWGYQYVEASLYAAAVQAYVDTFSAVKVVFFDQLRTDPKGLMRELYEFLGVSASFVPDVGKKYNEAGLPRYPWR